MSEKVVTSIVCPGCGCLCDDIDVRMEGNSVLQVNNVCSWGLGRFTDSKKFAQKKERKRPDGHFVLDGDSRKVVSLEDACSKAAEIIMAAGRVFFYGLCQSGNRAQAKIYDLGKKLGATFIPSEGPLVTLFLEESKSAGFSLCTLEEVRNRADVVVFWGANPIHSCPRLVTRYALFARGRFTERGEEDRKAFIVDLNPTELTKVSNRVILKEGDDLALLRALRVLVEGKKVEEYGSVKPGEVKNLAEALKEGQYIAFFCGRGPFYGKTGRVFISELIDLVRFLNKKTDCVLLPLATDFNTMGFYQTVLRNGPAEVVERSIMHDVREWVPAKGDVVIGIGNDFIWFLSDDQKAKMKEEGVSVISISSYETLSHVNSAVSLTCALAGIEVGDVAYRLDCLPVELKGFREPKFPSDREILEMLENYLKI